MQLHELIRIYINPKLYKLFRALLLFEEVEKTFDEIKNLFNRKINDGVVFLITSKIASGLQ